jgi:hypothetical protein
MATRVQGGLTLGPDRGELKCRKLTSWQSTLAADKAALEGVAGHRFAIYKVEARSAIILSGLSLYQRASPAGLYLFPRCMIAPIMTYLYKNSHL